ncbi:ATP-binding cassette domain-containing protein [Adlercreutzia sp. ZJ141]|uniref:ATP-binding cassette domain-containing protein n=1 Tax=Adlercreutzia sp. ZJ141 TaxID=2709406 RepID=UPI00273A1B49|nr:ATP-binding cassette domain-containing protein [Adlercreutzia sp. ZJ141]
MSSELALELREFCFSYPEPPDDQDGSSDLRKGAGERLETAGVGPINWCVSHGEFHVLTGGTGSGKTTLLRSCKPSIAPVGRRSGDLLVLGQPIEHLSCFEAAARIGYVAQSPESQMVCDTVWREMAFGLENVGVAPDVMHRRVAEVAHFFGIEPWFRRRVDELSGGQRQVLALASTLALRPSVLLLDEPTSQLDPIAEKTFLHALFRVNRELGMTVVVATHSPEAMLPYATHLAHLADGRVCVRRVEGSVSEGSRGAFGNCPETACTAAASAVSAPLAATRVVVATHADADASDVATTHAVGVTTHTDVASRAVSTCADAIICRDVYMRYDQSDFVLRGLDLRVLEGSVHALIGGNGCGKTTLLHTVAHIVRPVRGRVENRLHDSQALLPQNPKALFVCDTVLDELREWQRSAGYSDAAIDKMLASIGLTHRVSAHPYDLSGGQQQLLALAKLLLTNPSLLLLDEPTKGLDAPTKLLVATLIAKRARSGATVLLATHDLSFAARIADTITLLFDGQNACTQPAADFFSDNLFYCPPVDELARLWDARTAAAAVADGTEDHAVADGAEDHTAADGVEDRAAAADNAQVVEEGYRLAEEHAATCERVSMCGCAGNREKERP